MPIDKPSKDSPMPRPNSGLPKYTQLLVNTTDLQPADIAALLFMLTHDEGWIINLNQIHDEYGRGVEKNTGRLRDVGLMCRHRVWWGKFRRECYSVSWCPRPHDWHFSLCAYLLSTNPTLVKNYCRMLRRNPRSGRVLFEPGRIDHFVLSAEEEYAGEHQITIPIPMDTEDMDDEELQEHLLSVLPDHIIKPDTKFVKYPLPVITAPIPNMPESSPKKTPTNTVEDEKKQQVDTATEIDFKELAEMGKVVGPALNYFRKVHRSRRQDVVDVYLYWNEMKKDEPNGAREW